MKAHIIRWNNKWFVSNRYKSCIGCVFDKFIDACNHASYLTLMNKRKCLH